MKTNILAVVGRGVCNTLVVPRARGKREHGSSTPRRARKEPIMANMEQVHEFIKNYYTSEYGEVERKSYKRFKAVMPKEMGEDAIKTAYTAFAGDTPTYNLHSELPKWKREDYKDKAHRIADALTHDPTSFTDIATNAVVPIHEADSSLRKCFQAMFYAGIIGCMEIKTCGKCHIRLYYLND